MRTAEINGTAKQDKSGKTVLAWDGEILRIHWRMTDAEGTIYVSKIRQRLADNGKTLTMAKDYREPGMHRIRDWVFEKQQ